MAFLLRSVVCRTHILDMSDTLPQCLTISDVGGISEILEDPSCSAQVHFLSFLVRKFSQNQSRSRSRSKDARSPSPLCDCDFLPSGSLQSIFTMANRDKALLSSKKMPLIGHSSKCFSREFLDSESFYGSDKLVSASKDELDALELDDVPSLELPKQQLSIMVTAPSKKAVLSEDTDRDWSPETRTAAKTIWDDGSMIDLMKQFENSSEVWEDCVKQELNEDPVLWCLSKDAREQLKNPKQVVDMLHELQRSINLIDRFIPELTNNLTDDDSKIYITNVIQELLKRAQQSELSQKIRNDFSAINYRLENQSLYSEDDIEKMVNLIAWVRNNLTASCVTDENDAKMACLGAREVQQSLKYLLKTQAENNTRPRSNAENLNMHRDSSEIPLRHLSA